MPAIRLPLTSLTDGVRTTPMPDRSPGSIRAGSNLLMRRVRGIEKRPGTQIVKSPVANYRLDVSNPTQNKNYVWIERSELDRFVCILDPANAGDARMQIFTLATRGTGAGTPGNEIAGQAIVLTVTNHPVGGENPLDYISTGSSPAAVQRRFRAVTVSDATIITHRGRVPALDGSDITYEKEDASDIRDKANSNNVQSYNDLPQPPTGTAAPGDLQNDFIYFTQDDDLGWPAGWYRASSTTTPPWYTRIRTESANSLIDYTTFPIRLDFVGTGFTVYHPTWPDRYSGDSFTNPGPQVASGDFGAKPIRDLCFFQGRLWFGGGEYIDSTQIGDVFNLWNQSYVTVTDRDPVNVSLQGDTAGLINWMVPFDGGLVILTFGDRQYEVKSQGAMTPSTVSLLPTTNVQAVETCAPTKMGNQLYWCGEQNDSVVVWEYIFQEDRSSSVASNITAEVEGYILTRPFFLRSSSQNEVVFLRNSSELRTIYVCQMQWREGKAAQRAWSKWTFADDIMDFQVMGSVMYLIVKRNNQLYLETLWVDLPSDDDDGLTPTTVNGYSGSGDMSFAVRLDSRGSYQGSYNAGTNETTWTIPYEDENIDRVVLGQMWDANYEFPPASGIFFEQRRKGKVLTPDTEGGVLEITVGGGTTTIVTLGNYATNGNGDNAPCWIGVSFEKRAILNEQFARDENGQAVQGLVQLKHLMVRLAGTGYLRVEVTPQGRDMIPFEYVKDLVGQAVLGEGLTLPEYDEFNLPCMGSAYKTQIDLVNDTPFPSRVIGGEFKALFVPSKTDPRRR